MSKYEELDELDQIQARDDSSGPVLCDEPCSAECVAVNDRRTLLALVREHQAQIDVLTMACEEAEECGRDSISVAGIRAALTATDGAA